MTCSSRTNVNYATIDVFFLSSPVNVGKISDVDPVGRDIAD